MVPDLVSHLVDNQVFRFRYKLSSNWYFCSLGRHPNFSSYVTENGVSNFKIMTRILCMGVRNGRMKYVKIKWS